MNLAAMTTRELVEERNTLVNKNKYLRGRYAIKERQIERLKAEIKKAQADFRLLDAEIEANQRALETLGQEILKRYKQER